jgi:hypothetical protein
MPFLFVIYFYEPLLYIFTEPDMIQIIVKHTGK